MHPEDNVQLVVLGHQKSGTTAIGALLGRISGFGMSSDPVYMIDQGSAEVAQSLIHQPKLLRQYCRRRRDLFSQKIIKDPDLIFIYPSLKECYRNSKFLFVVRDPRDMIRSICNRLALKGIHQKILLSKADMKNGNRHWELILSGNLPRINEAIQNDSNFILNLARRWNLAAEIYMNNANDMSVVKYEQFLADKEMVIKKTAVEVGLPCVRPISEYIDVQYQPRGDRKVDWLEFFGPNNLSGIEKVCGNYMRALGYPF